ncbi:glutathione S-transferase family protein [Loktanella sp. Alg231-35]|uniref:glutathione S-transferase family protein n=1 Tax=Loktanella sp. Alg231-35 TaxID=1922220 RepID=UPI000D55CC85|nr:glutathione S-transferase C-terminal domain-containing protein [Loktanella sp. Alg231-35]
MGYMVEGVYHEGDDVTQTLPSGAWERSRSTVRNWIGDATFPAEAGRYHLFVAWNCPWAHRTLLTRAIKGLDAITVSYAKPNRDAQGWIFDAEGEFADPLLGVRAVHEVYSADQMRYTGRLTVPVLWDKVQGRMVSNESADIVRMLNASFDGADLYPDGLADEINQWNDLIYDTVNNGVYRAGFASTQAAYEKAAHQVFETLDRIDAHLADHPWLCGNQFTEADLRLFPTLARFDVAYHYAFRCNLKKLSDYVNLWPYAKRIYAMPGVSETVRFDIYKQGYFSASEKRNPLGIVPIGPMVDWGTGA